MWEGDEQDLASTRELKFAAIELGRSPVLGSDVRLEVSPSVTVLVGRNGAGKSAILERIHAGIARAVGAGESRDPPQLACEAGVWGDLLRYSCVWEQDNRGSSSSVAEERLKVLSPVPKLLWELFRGQLLLGGSGGLVEALPPEISCLQWTARRRPTGVVPTMARPLVNLFTSASYIRPGALRGEGERRALIIPENHDAWTKTPEYSLRRELGRLLLTLHRWHGKDDALLAELVALGRRTGLCEEIRVKIYRDPDRSSGNDLVSASVDGVDLGLLSDGTIRGLEILRALVQPETKLVLIDEPESAVHPGLLGKLLHEVEAYSTDRQVILSTHSPQVVSWTRPEAIRLVERRDGVTTVRGLGEKAIRYLGKYLHDEDTLGEFVFGGGLDDFSE